MGALMFWLLASQLKSININNEYREYDLDRKAVYRHENITLSNFETSLRFFWGIAEFSEGWDSLNNPYVEFKGH